MVSSLNLTIVIPGKNEERNLSECLTAIGCNFAARVIVIDSDSNDATVTIAKNYDAEVIDFKWDGQFPKKRNWFLRNYTPSTDWVLFLDADEFITSEFKSELRRILPNSQHSGFWLSYSIYFLGKKLKGGYPLRKLALFRVGAGEYERIDEARWSQLDMEVHEHPVLTGSVGVITSRIDHQDFRGITHYVAKHNDYSSWEAARFLSQMTNPTARAQWTWKQRLKYRLMRTPLIGPVYFLGSFIFMGGFRDGATGFVFSWLKSAYFIQVYCKIKELESLNR